MSVLTQPSWTWSKAPRWSLRGRNGHASHQPNGHPCKHAGTSTGPGVIPRPARPSGVLRCYARAVSSLATGPLPVEPGQAQATSSDRTRWLPSAPMRPRAGPRRAACAARVRDHGRDRAGAEHLGPDPPHRRRGSARGRRLVLGRRGRRWGASRCCCSSGSAALTFASIAWSVQPAELVARGRTGRCRTWPPSPARSRWRGWPRSAGERSSEPSPVFSIVVCGYALLVKVFPETFDRVDELAVSVRHSATTTPPAWSRRWACRRAYGPGRGPTTAASSET